MPVILAIDVGNSRVKFGLFGEVQAAVDASSRLAVPDRTLTVALSDSVPWQELSSWIDGHQVTAVIAGPNPAGVERIRSDWKLPGPPPREISNSTELGLEIHVDFPDRVGIDRLLNAVAANVLRPPDQIAIVVSSGTATTIDLVSKDGAFEGGVILPGFELAARSLHDHTALLPLIAPAELAEQAAPPALGKNTAEAIRGGVLYGQVGAVSELIERLAAGREAFVILTGGGGPLLARHLNTTHVLEHTLALRALAYVASRSCPVVPLRSIERTQFD